ncbi:MAG: hypothetical protein ACYC7A_01975 [Thermoanaerobaculia bacterium]
MQPLCTIFLLTLLATTLSAQSTPQPDWEYWAGIDAVFTRDDATLAPTLMADTERFHLEARHNYEGMNTTSLWGGYTVRSADGESWAVTPMLGAAFGDTRGVLPGAEAIINWRALDVYLELEHLFSTGGESDDFTYCWAELAVSPTEWLRAGIVSQATWPAGAPDSEQHGALLGFSYRDLTLTSFLFDAGSDDEMVVVTAAVEF